MLNSDFLVFVEADNGERGVILGLNSVAALICSQARLSEGRILSVLAAVAGDCGTWRLLVVVIGCGSRGVMVNLV